MSIEEIEIEGFVGQNPKYASEKYPDMLSFSVGVSQGIKNKQTNEWESKTSWYEVISWDKEKSAYLFQKVFKGDKVIVKGRPAVKSYTGKDGAFKAAITINLTKIALMKKEGDNALQNSVHATAKSSAQVEEYYDNQHISGKFKLNAKAPVVETPIYEDEIPF
jgi:single-stranded DNA-binding protein